MRRSHHPAIVGTDVEHGKMSWAALDMIPDAVFLVGAKGTVQRANRVAADLFGRLPTELLGAHLGDLLECQDLDVGGWFSRRQIRFLDDVLLPPS